MTAPVFSTHRLKPAPADPELHERDERLESLKAVVGKLAHDFNNFLVPQLGYVTLIKEDLAEGSISSQYAETLEQAARKTESTLESILLGMRPHRHFNPRSFNLSESLEQTVQMWRAELPDTAQITLKSEITPGCELVGDPEQWINVFKQILSNARFALATGGNLEVALRRENLPETQMADLGIAESNVLVITFKDDGFGMSPAVLKRAFEPFFTTRTQVKVAGIGLTIVHSVVHLHGGQVQVFTSEDVGTTFTIYAPLLSLHQLKPSLRAPGSKVAFGKILLVEDDPLVREVLRTTMQRHHREVVTATNGEEGLHTFKRSLGQWDLVVSDVAMPKMNGIDFVQAIRTLEKDIRVILVSGDPSAHDSITKGLADPRPLLIKKPFTLRSFSDVIRSYLPTRIG